MGNKEIVNLIVNESNKRNQKSQWGNNFKGNFNGFFNSSGFHFEGERKTYAPARTLAKLSPANQQLFDSCLAATKVKNSEELEKLRKSIIEIGRGNKNWWELFGSKTALTKKELESKTRGLSRIAHSDKNREDPEEEKIATAIFSFIQGIKGELIPYCKD